MIPVSDPWRVQLRQGLGGAHTLHVLLRVMLHREAFAVTLSQWVQAADLKDGKDALRVGLKLSATTWQPTIEKASTGSGIWAAFLPHVDHFCASSKAPRTQES